MPQKNLIVLVGPTGVGKTETSLKLAEYFRAPIINADSRQIYKGMTIGTAAPTEEDRKRVTHFGVQFLNPGDYYSAAQFELDVMQLLEELFLKHDYVVLSGGSMMYIDAVCNGIDDIPTVDAETRKMMLERYEKEGLEPLVRELRILDPEYYRIVDLKNPKRVIHALEICYMTGKPYSSFRTNKKKERPFRIIKIGLKRDREILYERINNRVTKMLEDGLEDEVKALLPYRGSNALNTVGYKEMFAYLDGKMTYDEAADKIRQNSRIYSRKQMTWFKRDEQIQWFEPEQVQDIISHIVRYEG
ncbi:MAG: tRNA (adenosine(37)-N6)-dimethylallyltransferase MiaA [Candidatus Paraprevotella stercoravium]|uniref:tRNA dimethylallyltransferase n=1 Tax=Candidatus Paraprevotella stercoravium TaxID=2838725 RepID=A0A9E2P1V7_9BACT|nr:tRNA (adenosine(37)-N6)-dimethylallyltransferase MiaA [Candidatus Paraprevotella stercoravium]